MTYIHGKDDHRFTFTNTTILQWLPLFCDPKITKSVGAFQTSTEFSEITGKISRINTSSLSRLSGKVCLSKREDGDTKNKWRGHTPGRTPLTGHSRGFPKVPSNLPQHQDRPVVWLIFWTRVLSLPSLISSKPRNPEPVCFKAVCSREQWSSAVPDE